ncbi:hypothetical protein ACEYW6_11985 [Nostoc sp. UIC 10607]|uniref:hypothetical protein n=1 Tax=Nostoc sp. UIC 10607 TaxID=3045935 RepID=UPI0039A144E1
MTAEDFQDLLVGYLGDNWFDFFYPEFCQAIADRWSTPYQDMANLKKQGWSFKELNHHPLYGFWVNLVEYHPNMKALTKRISSFEH